MSAKNESGENIADREIVITRTYAARRELVWRAMTDPAQVVQWWGPRGFSTTIEVMDLRVGGVWKHVMRGPDGTEYPNQSTFLEVTAPERIVYRHSGGKAGAPGVGIEMTWTFEAIDADTTRLTLRQIYPDKASRDTTVKVYGAIEGGKQTLERLAEFLAL
jgi:uncharacterized protein YndB with AHSA1/START domain